MSSLRARLIIGSALVAIAPLAIAMLLLAWRVERLARDQAADRLRATVGALEAGLRAEGERTADKLEILANDPTLRRGYLPGPTGAGDLADYLSERRVLLGLDFLEVADTSGAVITAGSLFSGRLSPAVRHATGTVLESVPGRGLAIAVVAPIRYNNETLRLLHGGTLVDSTLLQRLKRTSGVELLVRDGTGRVVASTVRDAQDVGSAALSGISRIDAAGGSWLGGTFPLQAAQSGGAAVTGLVPAAPLDRTITALRVGAALLAALGIALAIVLGTVWSSQVSRPVERLADYSRKLSHGEWDEPLALESVRELETLVESLDRMRTELKAQRDRLRISERHEAWSTMARAVAHEIKNPLTPIAVSMADLKRSYEQRRADFPQILDQAVRTIGAEVETLKGLLQEFSEFGRFAPAQLAPVRVADVLTGLRALYAGEIAAGRLTFGPEIDGGAILQADAAQLQQALVNLVKNGLEALGGGGRVTVSAHADDRTVEIAVADTGHGLSDEQKARLFVPGFTTKGHGSGLGLAVVERIVNDHRGTIAVESAPGAGTTFRIRLPLEGKA